jgi:hypothetical protein
MAKYAVNFAITVWVDSDKINEGEIGEDVTDTLSDKEWNELVNDALNVMEIGAENLTSIERIEED